MYLAERVAIQSEWREVPSPPSPRIYSIVCLLCFYLLLFFIIIIILLLLLLLLLFYVSETLFYQYDLMTLLVDPYVHHYSDNTVKKKHMGSSIYDNSMDEAWPSCFTNNGILMLIGA